MQWLRLLDLYGVRLSVLMSDVEKVIMGEPWSYARHLVILHRYDGKTPLADLQLSTAMFWVQIHNLPFSMLSPEIAMDIGDTLRGSQKTREYFRNGRR